MISAACARCAREKEVFSQGLPRFVEKIRLQLDTMEKRLLRAYRDYQEQDRIRGPPYLTETEPETWKGSAEQARASQSLDVKVKDVGKQPYARRQKGLVA